MRRTAALIVGGGPAGSAAAIMLGRAGHEVELLERANGPRDVVCGGFLGWDALAALDRLGIDALALGARPIKRIRLASAERMIEAPLPHRAAGLSRRVLDEALLSAAARAGAAVRRGTTVKAVEEPRCVRLDSGEKIAADALLLATGKHELRGAARPREVLGANAVVGVRSVLAPSRALRETLGGVIELHLFDGGYAGLLLQEDGSANLCLSIARDRLKQAGGIDALIAELSRELPCFGQRLNRSATEGWEAVAGVPYGWRARRTERGLFRLGDQGAVIASLAGDGIAIALTSGIDAAAALLRGGAQAAQAFQNNFSLRAARPLAIASGLRRAAENPKTRRPLMRLFHRVPYLLTVGAALTRIAR